MGGVAWTEEEDQLLKKCIERYGEGKWHRVPLLAGNYHKWSLIAGRLPGRTANDVKNYWNCHLSKKLNNAQETEEEYQNGMKMETLKPQPRCIAVTGSIKPRTQDHFAPKNQPTIQESTMPTPFNFVEVDKQQGQELVKEEEDIREEAAGGVFFGDLATEDHQFGQLDEVNVLSSTEGCSKWDWDDLMLDMDLWTDSL
ncbi:hypothetical protein Gorai_019605 [Gossypium raimondii]|uniref:HTH myb-type domain-containing protein n=1 Tax=Gossypium raimondii TaxID=29730 RepID=A0A7J8PP68_GOSRA|nr:hypothetical protein [Gossypium raimondii]